MDFKTCKVNEFSQLIKILNIINDDVWKFGFDETGIKTMNDDKCFLVHVSVHINKNAFININGFGECSIDMSTLNLFLSNNECNQINFNIDNKQIIFEMIGSNKINTLEMPEIIHNKKICKRNDVLYDYKIRMKMADFKNIIDLHVNHHDILKIECSNNYIQFTSYNYGYNCKMQNKLFNSPEYKIISGVEDIIYTSVDINKLMEIIKHITFEMIEIELYKLHDYISLNIDIESFGKLKLMFNTM